MLRMNRFFTKDCYSFDQLGRTKLFLELVCFSAFSPVRKYILLTNERRNRKNVPPSKAILRHLISQNLNFCEVLMHLRFMYSVEYIKSGNSMIKIGSIIFSYIHYIFEAISSHKQLTR